MPIYIPNTWTPQARRITVFDHDQHLVPLHTMQATFGNFGATAANLARYVPIYIQETVTAYAMSFLARGAPSGNFDLGIYDQAGNRLTSTGSTAMPSRSNAWATGDFADVVLTRGVYYLAMALSSSSQQFTFVSFTSAGYTPRMLGCYSQSSALPLPATATFSANTGETLLPYLSLDLRGF